MMRLTLFYSRPYNFTGADGADVSGAIYAGRDEKGKIIKFSSRDLDKQVYPESTRFQAELADDFDLVQRFDELTGRIKFSEKI